MTGPSVGPLSRCPFAHCAADVMLVVEQAAPSDDEATLKRVPQHRIVGEAERFGQCPASLMVIPLDAYSREALTTQAQAFGLMLRGDKPEGDPYSGSAPRPLKPASDTRHPWFSWNPGGGTGGVNVPQHGKAGQGIVPLPDTPHAGPGPGRASKPYQPTPDDIVEQVVPPKLTVVPNTEQGSTGDMEADLRAQLIALTALAIEGFGQEQELCASLTQTLETTFGAIRKALADKQTATHSVALAAVGSRSDVPTSAANMIGASSSAGSAIEAMAQAETTLRQWIDATHAYTGSAAASGREYLAQI
jgi:hypothetical protein